MRTYLDCIPCFMQQALRAARIAATGEIEIKHILDETARLIPEISMAMSPAEIGEKVYSIVSRVSGAEDPYKELKNASLAKALEIVPYVKERIRAASDPLYFALKAAIAGNVIDFGVNNSFDLEKEFDEIFDKTLAIDDYNLFTEKYKAADSILYIGDNAGETAFDKILIENLEKPVIFAVRDKPVINDVTYADAAAAGIDSVAKIVSTGTAAPGVVLDRCSDEFVSLFNSAPLVISKGQGNYEALSGAAHPVFFMLKAKCEVVARHLNVNEGDLILKFSEGK